MLIIIVLGVIVWLTIPLVLSRAMARRGYDRGSYLILGALFGPVAVAFAVMEVLDDAPEPPRILEDGQSGNGDLSILVVIGGEPTTPPPATILAGLGPRLRRVGVAQVLPQGGPREDERRAERDLREAATNLGHPELAVLFGRPDVAISRHAAARGYDVVFTSRPDPLLSAHLNGSGRIHLRGDQGMPSVTRPMPTAPWHAGGTEALPARPAPVPQAARTA
jgi:hypothetical protein